MLKQKTVEYATRKLVRYQINILLSTTPENITFFKNFKARDPLLSISNQGSFTFTRGNLECKLAHVVWTTVT